MPKEILTIEKIKKSEPREKEYLINDGANLYLKVLPSGTKSFFFIAHKAEQNKKIAVKKSLGKFPNISLAEAKIKAQKERDKLTNITINEVNSTFKECFLKYCEHKKMH